MLAALDLAAVSEVEIMLPAVSGLGIPRLTSVVVMPPATSEADRVIRMMDLAMEIIPQSLGSPELIILFIRKSP